MNVLAERRADGGAVSVTHRAQASAGQKMVRTFGQMQILSGPDLVLTDVCRVGRIRTGHLADRAHQLMRLDDRRIVFGMVVPGLPRVDLMLPLEMLFGLDHGQQLLEHVLDVSDDRIVDLDVFSDFTRVDIDMDDLGVSAEFFHVQGHTVRKTGTLAKHHCKRV